MGRLHVEGVNFKIPLYITMLAKDLQPLTWTGATGQVAISVLTTEVMRNPVLTGEAHPRPDERYHFVGDWWKRLGEPCDLGDMWNPVILEGFQVYCSEVCPEFQQYP
jgi:hypothetical protein